MKHDVNFGLEFFFEGLQLLFANQVCRTHVIHNVFLKDKGYMDICNFCFFTSALSLISIRAGGTGGDVPQEPSLPQKYRYLQK